MPLKTATPPASCSPRIRPPVTSTSGGDCATTLRPATAKPAATSPRLIPLMGFWSPHPYRRNRKPNSDRRDRGALLGWDQPFHFREPGSKDSRDHARLLAGGDAGSTR